MDVLPCFPRCTADIRTVAECLAIRQSVVHVCAVQLALSLQFRFIKQAYEENCLSLMLHSRRVGAARHADLLLTCRTKQ